MNLRSSGYQPDALGLLCYARGIPSGTWTRTCRLGDGGSILLNYRNISRSCLTRTDDNGFGDRRVSGYTKPL